MACLVPCDGWVWPACFCAITYTCVGVALNIRLGWDIGTCTDVHLIEAPKRHLLEVGVLPPYQQLGREVGGGGGGRGHFTAISMSHDSMYNIVT